MATFTLMAPPGLLLSSQLFLLITIVAYCHQHHLDCQIVVSWPKHPASRNVFSKQLKVKKNAM
jgi:hypothetical protein